MNKIIKTIPFLLLSTIIMLSANVVYAGGKDLTIYKGSYGRDYEKTIYASHDTLIKLVDAEKTQKKNQKSYLQTMSKLLGKLPDEAKLLGKIPTAFVWAEDVLTHLFGDSSFLSRCLEKSEQNGQRGCIMKYTYIEHDETPDEWYPDSCELQ